MPQTLPLLKEYLKEYFKKEDFLPVQLIDWKYHTQENDYLITDYSDFEETCWGDSDAPDYIVLDDKYTDQYCYPATEDDDLPTALYNAVNSASAFLVAEPVSTMVSIVRGALDDWVKENQRKVQCLVIKEVIGND